MKTKWTGEMRAAARERFWSPVLEMAGAILENHPGYAGAMEALEDLGAHVDASIFGRRFNSPVFRFALAKIIREKSGIAADDRAA